MRKIVVPQTAVSQHEETLGKALLSYLEHLLQGGTLTWGRDGQYQATNDCRHYWQWIYAEFKNNHILTASPIELFRFAKENMEKTAGMSHHYRTDIRAVIDQLFAYDKFRAGHVLAKVDGKGKIQWSKAKKRIASWKGWSLGKYFQLIDVRYCPYCNAETVGLVKRDNPKFLNRDSYSAIDHILPKEDYPLLALSLCNLIPVCYKCNSQYKGDKDLYRIKEWPLNSPLLALHPYVHDFYKWFCFEYAPTSVENMFVHEFDDSSPLSVKIMKPFPNTQQSFYDSRVRRYLETFELPNSYRDLYATEINQILKMAMICTSEFVSEMKRLYEGLSDSDFDLTFRRTSLDSCEINQHRFAKLTIDLIEQIGRDGTLDRTVMA